VTNHEEESNMRTIKQALLYTALTATIAGAAGLANAAPRSPDPYTDGARVTNRDGMAERNGTRDPYTDGGRAIHDPRSPYTDGGFSAIGKRDAFTDGA
jgi:hypothetical protein